MTTTVYADGTVTVTYKGNVVRVTGDAADNAIAIDWSNHYFSVFGFSTQIAGPVQSTIRLNPKTRLIISMKGGNDKVAMNLYDAGVFDLPYLPPVFSLFYIHMGNGNDFLGIAHERSGETIAANTVTLNMGNGHDTFRHIDGGFETKRGLWLLGGNGQDLFEHIAYGPIQNTSDGVMTYSSFETHRITDQR